MLDLVTIFTSVYSFISLFFVIILSSFVLIPGTSVWIASTASFASNIQSLLLIMFFVLIASLIGDYAAYFIARRYSDKAKNFLRKRNWYNKNEEKTLRTLNKYGFAFVFFSRFLISGSGPIVNYLSGFEKMSVKKFITAVFFGEVIFSITYALIGYTFKDTWSELLASVQYGLIALALIALAIYLIYRIIRFYKNRRKYKL